MSLPPRRTAVNDSCMVPRTRARVILLRNRIEVEIIAHVVCAECGHQHEPDPRPFGDGIIETCVNCGQLLYRAERV